MHDALAFARAMERNPHLKEYVETFAKEHKTKPEFHLRLSPEMAAVEFPNLIYLAGEPVLVHIYREKGEDVQYIVIEPRLTKDEEEKYEKIFEQLLFLAQRAGEPRDKEELRKQIDEFLRKIAIMEGEKSKIDFSLTEKIPLTKKQFTAIRYNLYRNIMGMGMLESFSRDPYIEDIFGSGLGHVFVMHKIFRTLKTNIVLKSDVEIDEFCYRVSERIEKPVSDAVPITDGTLQDGSRVNIVYSRAISKRGSSFSVRKFFAEPLSITRIVSLGSLSSEAAAYLWIAVENGMNIFFCGESACGKTSLLNAACTFIQPMAKVYSCEDTIEVTVPHKCWQQLTTRGGGPRGQDVVEMSDLLISSLRSRPNYIIVGEIRGVEGSIAFQAMQTGHPVLSAFHASSVRKMIQRLTGNPINVPIAYMDNLNVAVVMGSVFRNRVQLRRVLEVAEIEGYSPEAGGVVIRKIFDWDTVLDKHTFKGMFNSFILEDKIAPILGYDDKRKIYEDLALRTRVIDELVRKKIFDYYEVHEIVKNFYYHGKKGLPFQV